MSEKMESESALVTNIDSGDNDDSSSCEDTVLEEPHAVIHYRNCTSNKELEIVHHSMIKDFTSSMIDNFRKDKLYKVFWSPIEGDSLEEMLKRVSEIPVFGLKLMCKQAGYYRASISAIKGSLAELKEFIEKKRIQIVPKQNLQMSFDEETEGNHTRRVTRNQKSKNPVVTTQSAPSAGKKKETHSLKNKGKFREELFRNNPILQNISESVTSEVFKKMKNKEDFSSTSSESGSDQLTSPSKVRKLEQEIVLQKATITKVNSFNIRLQEKLQASEDEVDTLRAQLTAANAKIESLQKSDSATKLTATKKCLFKQGSAKPAAFSLSHEQAVQQPSFSENTPAKKLPVFSFLPDKVVSPSSLSSGKSSGPGCPQPSGLMKSSSLTSTPLQDNSAPSSPISIPSTSKENLYFPCAASPSMVLGSGSFHAEEDFQNFAVSQLCTAEIRLSPSPDQSSKAVTPSSSKATQKQQQPDIPTDDVSDGNKLDEKDQVSGKDHPTAVNTYTLNPGRVMPPKILKLFKEIPGKEKSDLRFIKNAAVYIIGPETLAGSTIGGTKKGKKKPGTEEESVKPGIDKKLFQAIVDFLAWRLDQLGVSPAEKQSRMDLHRVKQCIRDKQKKLRSAGFGAGVEPKTTTDDDVVLSFES